MKKNIIITISALFSFVSGAFADDSAAVALPGQAVAEVEQIQLVDVSGSKAIKLFRASVENQVKAINKWLDKGDTVNALSYFAALYNKDSEKATKVMLADKRIQFVLMTQLPVENIRQYFQDWMGVDGEDEEGNVTYKKGFEIQYQSIDLGSEENLGDFVRLNIPLACVHNVLKHEFSKERTKNICEPWAGGISTSCKDVTVSIVDEDAKNKAFSHIARVFEELDTDFVLKMINTSKRYVRKESDKHRSATIMRRITDEGVLESFYRTEHNHPYCDDWYRNRECAVEYAYNQNGCKEHKQNVYETKWYVEKNQECSLPFYFDVKEGNPADYVVDQLLPFWIHTNEALATELMEKIHESDAAKSKEVIGTLPCDRLMDLLENYGDSLLDQIFELCESDDDAFDSLFGDDIFGEALPALGDGSENEDAA